MNYFYQFSYNDVIIISVAFVVVLILFLLVSQQRNRSRSSSLHLSNGYVYSNKPYIMTDREMEFFRRIDRLVRSKYYVFPQVHLDSIINHKIKGQNWKAALASIQRKSVDFVLVDRDTLMTSYAVELDDATHDAESRVERDDLVSGYLARASVPLVRIRYVGQLSDEAIKDIFRRAGQNVGTRFLLDEENTSI